MIKRIGSLPAAAIAAGLIAIVAVLVGLQLRWTRAWSESETARLTHFVATGVGRIAIDLDRALADLEESFRRAAAAAPGGDDAALGRSAEQWWASAPDAQLVRLALWLGGVDGSGSPRQLLADGSVRAVPWPDELAAWQRAVGELRSGADVVALPSSPPAMLVPVLREPDAGPQLALLILDVDELRARRLPDLIERHVGGAFGGDVRVVVTHGEEAVYSRRPVAAGLEPDAERCAGGQRVRISADGGEVSISRGAAIEGSAVAVREVETRSSGADARPRMAGFRPIAFDRPTWCVRAHHVAGSIGAAVRTARRWDLAAGLGALALLVAAAILLALAARRAHVMARRQVDFVAGVTHDLRTPLTVISSAAENLRDSVVTRPDDARRYGALIHDEARRLARLVEQALSLAGATRIGPAEPVELAPLVARSVERLRGRMADPVDVALDVEPAAPPALVDPTSLEQVIDNLLDNAVTHGGRELGVRVRRAGDDVVEVTVWDRGTGVPAEEQERVFEPFYRGLRARQDRVSGSGLGLSIVRRVVEAQGGSVCLRSENGSGSAFMLRLPARGGR